MNEWFYLSDEYLLAAFSVLIGHKLGIVNTQGTDTALKKLLVS